MPAGTAIYFLSDAHLGAEPMEREASRQARLHEFLTDLRGRASALFIVGDLFDFWIEYATAIPRRYFETLAVLRDVKRAGVELHVLNGNHDFWFGDFLSEELGAMTHAGPIALELQGRRIWLHHGDGLVGGDLGYRVIRRVIRHPAAVRFYQFLHPDLGIPLARAFSRLSRDSRERRPLDGERLWREVARPRFAEGFDTVMVGHFHHIFERREGRHAFFVLGDWMDHFTYAVLENGELRLESWPAR